MSRRFWDIQMAAQALATGRILIVLDSEDRENEGDLLIAAEKATPEAIYFMLRRACGQLCVPVAAEIASRLDLTPMTTRDQKLSSTAFAVPVDHCSCRTGISPEERSATIQALLRPSSRPEDFVRPGHVFPLIAREGGVLRRPGHTEAAVDLAQLAGLAPAGVLCEVCSRDGLHMAGREELMELSEEFDLPILTIEDLIRFRRSLRSPSSVFQGVAAATSV
jgi:3,4-dihydroxy 2-butanone 4-phosphate synthase/GTP cyclohydrolase II